MFEEGETYYIRIRGLVQGPFDLEQLKKLRQRGQFSRAHEVSSDQSSWQSASILDAVFVAPKRAAPAKVEPTPEEQLVEAVDVEEAVPSPKTRTSSTKPVWRYTVGEEQYGPVTLLELRKLVANGEVMETDLVWRKGMPDWTAVGDVPEIKGGNIAAQGAPSGGNRAYCFACGTSIDIRAEVCPQCGVRQSNQTRTDKSRITTAILALVVGGLGIHRFYLGGGTNIVLGVVYILFIWTFIPVLISFIEGIYFLCMSDETFAASYGKR